MKRFLFIAAALGLGASAQAQTIYDGFDYTYTDGTQTIYQNGGSGWSDAWNDEGGSFFVRDGGLSFGSLTTSGNAAIGANTSGNDITSRDFATAYNDGDNFWFSFLSASDSTDITGGFEVRFRSGTTKWATFDLDDNIDLKDGGFSNDSEIDLSASGASTLIVGQVNLSASSGSDTLQYWINPGNLGGASPTTGSYASAVLTGNDVSSLDDIRIIARDMPAVFDEIRLGDSFASVTPIPEPQVNLLLCAGLGVFLLFRRRR